MAVVKPFRALRFDERRAGPLSALVAPPFDVLGPEERAAHLAKSPYNVVHLTLPESEGDAARAFAEWQQDGVLVADREPCFWALVQDYVGPDGVARTRTGLVASLRVEPYETRTVLPHERTHSGPKEGRLRLLRAVRAQLEPIFLLYDGERPFEVPARDADVAVEGARLWRLDGEELGGAFVDTQLLIADGHHRYETAVAYHAEVGTEESASMMVVLVSTSDPGLTIFPTHRLASELDGQELPPAAGDPRSQLARIEHESRSRATAVVYRDGGAGVLHGREGELDVELVERYAPRVSYTAYADEAIAAVDAGRAAAAFLLRPLLIDQVFAVARRGDVMPQKSTYFYPKLLSGLLFHPV